MTDPRAQELIETIRFYADETNYDASETATTSRVSADRGLRARSFLAQFEALNG